MVTFIAIPSIIRIAKVKKLTDDPGERGSHYKSVPTLGGIGLFAGVIFSIILWTPFEVFGNLQYILCAFVIIFLIGAKDDLLPLTPYKKMIGQTFAAFILVFKANIRITSLYGIFGISLLPEWISILLSLFTILVIINAFNLLDGIDGFCASVGILICITLGFWFKMTDQIVLCIIASALLGSLMAFLKFNLTPAQIFMGDTGSMLIGIICSILVIRFIEHPNIYNEFNFEINASPAIGVALLFLPLFDTLRVFIVRLIHQRSPFKADRQHVHHIILDSGLNHLQTTALLLIINVVILGIIVSLQFLGNLNLVIIILSFSLFFAMFLEYLRIKKNVGKHKI